MNQATIETPKSIWKFVCFGLGLVWLLCTFTTTAYFFGRASSHEHWNFPDWLFGLFLLVMGLWFGSFILALRGWTKVAVTSWFGIVLIWNFLWIVTIAG